MKYYYVQLNNMEFKKGDAVTWGESKHPSAIVVKVYSSNWWRRMLKRIGFKTRINKIKVKIR